ncbi:MAG: oxidoreductase [Lewinellaceae bacterium]|nr:oxidoreductase [Lewinellaceae bacterium]
MPTLWYNATVSRIEYYAPDVRRFWLSMPDGERLAFRAGQFITLDLPIGDKRLQRWRSYSIASAPDPEGNAALELCIVRSGDGEGTRYLFDEVQEGSNLRFKGPDGAFYLPEALGQDVVMICTGTGIVPFRSMLLDLQQRKFPHQNIHLIFGTRYENGILYQEEMERFKATLPGFQYDIVLSREPEWDGYQGYVHQVYLEQYAEKRPDVQFYICGWSNMIDEAVANLMVKLGYDRTQIHFELYG